MYCEKVTFSFCKSDLLISNEVWGAVYTFNISVVSFRGALKLSYLFLAILRMKRSPHHMSFLFPFFQQTYIIIEVSTIKHPKQQVTTKLGCCKCSRHCSFLGKTNKKEEFSQGPGFD